MEIRKSSLLLLFLPFLMAGCEKEHAGPGDEAGGLKTLSGAIYYEWADEGVFKIDLAPAGRILFLEDDIKRNGWDISWDSRYVLECSDVPGDYQASRFKLIRTADGTVANEFTYYSTDGDIATGTLSPDGKKIAIGPTFRDGVVITDLRGNEIRHILTVNGEKLTEDPVWMPDNTLLLVHGKALLRTNAGFTDASLVKTFDFEEWGTPAVSRDGKRIAFSASKHIWLMNADGTDMRQVTTSGAAETLPQFSPDGKYLLIGTDFHITGPFGHLFYLKVIPADGNLYVVDDGKESRGVIPVQLPGEVHPEAANTRVSWR